MRLIDADEIRLPHGFFEKVDNVPKFYEWLGTLPTVDAMEVGVKIFGDGEISFRKVVKCKDCKHKPSGTGANHDVKFPDEICPCQCEDYWYSWIPKDYFFCAFGERREDELSV